MPDPLEAALEARNFGRVLEQFALLDRTNTLQRRHAGGDPLLSRGDRPAPARPRVARPAPGATDGLRSLRMSIRSSMATQKQRYHRSLRAGVRRLIDAPPRRSGGLAARRGEDRALRTDAASVVVNDIGGVSTGGNSTSVPLPAPSSVAASAVGVALGQLGTPYAPGGAAPGGFDCSGLVSWAYAQAGHPGLPHYTGDLWNSGTRVSSTSELAPGDLVFFNSLDHVGIYIGGGQFVEAPHSGDVVKVTSLASRSDYIGAVRISG